MNLNLAWCDGCRRTHVVIDHPEGTLRFDLSPEQTAELAIRMAGIAHQAASFFPTHPQAQCLLTLAASGDGRPS